MYLEHMDRHTFEEIYHYTAWYWLHRLAVHDTGMSRQCTSILATIKVVLSPYNLFRLSASLMWSHKDSTFPYFP